MAAAGSEANVAGLLAQLGRRTAWSTVLLIGDLSDRVLQEYRSVGVDTSHVIRTPTGRVALYFMEPGESPMPGKVLYDRHNTPFRTTTADHYDWEALLNTKAVFVTGITAALTETTAAVLYRLVDQADERGIEVILDVNHRTSLWSGDEAARTLAPIAEKAAMLFCSRTDAKAVFGIEGTGPETARALRDRFGSRHVISTDQVNGVYVSSGDIGEGQFDVERVPVVDRPGAGDAFVEARSTACSPVTCSQGSDVVSAPHPSP
ncbi:2-dehydro-3-deoxygluconokinase [Leifsonia xyli subsp. cynodontis DSM 46306]|uniref:Carbohydrate kinase PfkB domain-containing protein n=1 Tax=Leifsonia xyli subsp. cynodontis DSM 46306 TaxID=1389489 RepID=U3P9I4_LEIXC|nr:sugar kinase [Leifsonia xyli]AGW42486.1 2-dehydro-3-deoxygluconokinase [Leifsonia xyli subsp. cynodontis DSM 46306]